MLNSIPDMTINSGPILHSTVGLSIVEEMTVREYGAKLDFNIHQWMLGCNTGTV